MKVNVPQIGELKKLVDESVVVHPAHTQHRWGKIWIDYSSYELYDPPKKNLWLMKAQIRARRTCLDCGTRRTDTYHLYQKKDQVGWCWYRDPGLIYRRPSNYEESVCFRRDSGHGVKPFVCSVCGRSYGSKKKLIQCQKIHAQEEKRKQKIWVNLRIVRALCSKYKRLVGAKRKRLIFAIFRLYKYCDLSPNQIAQKTHLSYARVTGYIGEAFRSECLQDDSCVFKPLLEREDRK